jgi:adenosylcobinamide-phosphate guanylyltransferase
MIGFVMAGGRGSRMDMSEEKLLACTVSDGEYKKPVIFHVIDALKNSHCFSQVIVATSPNSPDTKHVLEQNRIETLSTPGNGYVSDLNFVLQKCADLVFITSGDLPLLDEKIIQVMIDKFLKGEGRIQRDPDRVYDRDLENVWTSFLVTKNFLDSLGLEHRGLGDEREVRTNANCAYTGISIINTKKVNWREKRNDTYIEENQIILNDKRIAFNLNTKKDYELLSSS